MAGSSEGASVSFARYLYCLASRSAFVSLLDPESIWRMGCQDLDQRELDLVPVVEITWAIHLQQSALTVDPLVRQQVTAASNRSLVLVY
jgi:hypothetical protein